MKSEKSYTGLYFLLIIIFLWFVILMINPNKVFEAWKVFIGILLKIIPVILLMFALMIFINYFIRQNTLIKYLGRGSGLQGWLISAIAGILSTGPIYLWYPLLNDMQKQGVRNGLIATFIYNRAIKLPLLPLLIMYFGLVYASILTVVVIIASFIQGYLTEKIIEVKI